MVEGRGEGLENTREPRRPRDAIFLVDTVQQTLTGQAVRVAAIFHGLRKI